MGSTCSSGHPVSLPLSSAASEGHMGSGRWGACLPSGASAQVCLWPLLQAVP